MRLLSVQCTISSKIFTIDHGHPDIVLPVFATVRSESHVECFHPILKGAFKGTNAGERLVQATLTDGAFRWNNNRSRDLGGSVCPTLDIPLLVAANNAYKANHKVDDPTGNLRHFSTFLLVKKNCLESSTQPPPLFFSFSFQL